MARDRSLTNLGESIRNFEHAAQDRLEDADALFQARRYASAIAHGLYALEIKLKIVICRRLDVPNLPRIFETHDLEALMLHSGLSNKVRIVKRPRAVTKNWGELLELSREIDEFRYRPDPRWNEALAKRVLHQLRDPRNGVVSWLTKQASLRKR